MLTVLYNIYILCSCVSVTKLHWCFRLAECAVKNICRYLLSKYNYFWHFGTTVCNLLQVQRFVGTHLGKMLNYKLLAYKGPCALIFLNKSCLETDTFYHSVHRHVMCFTSPFMTWSNWRHCTKRIIEQVSALKPTAKGTFRILLLVPKVHRLVFQIQTTTRGSQFRSQVRRQKTSNICSFGWQGHIFWQINTSF